MYEAWCGGVLNNNAAAYLPHLNDEQKTKIQRAANSGVQAVVGLPRYGEFPLTKIREDIGVASVEEISNGALMIEAWKRREKLGNQARNGPVTRGQSSGNVIAPDQRGWAGKTTHTKATLMWNDLPQDVRSEDDAKKARRKIKNTQKVTTLINR